MQTNHTVLVVDDNDEIRFLIAHFIKQLGLEVATAAHGAEALELLQTMVADLILLDMNMPGLSGLEVLQQLKGQPALAEIPVVVVSSESDVRKIAACLKLGATDYLPKPFDGAILEARVRSCLEASRLRKLERAQQAELERLVEERTAALRESEERYVLAMRGANDGLWDWDLRRRQLTVSARWKEIFGYGEHELGSNPDEWLSRVHTDDRERLEVKLSAHFRQLLSHFQDEFRVRHKDGSYRWVLCRGMAVWNEQGNATRMAGSLTDISDRKRAEQQMLHDALHDGLTGLPNRVLFQDRLKTALLRSERHAAYGFAVLFLDLDRFKIINDSLGHNAGDELLVAIARRLQTSVRPVDTVARLGGDEFTILLDGAADEETVLAVGERLQQLISEPIQLEGRDISTSASIGATLSTIGYTSELAVLRDADTAMYHAKARGKARTVLFNASMHAAALEQLQIESLLRWAVERDELRLHYQPIVALESRQVEGLEALVRWQHPERGLLLPGAFIAVAEETGLIVPIGWWVLRTACVQLQAWRAGDPALEHLWVTVNLSARQLAQPGLVQRVMGVLDETGLPAQCLKLEITETTLVEQGPRLAAELHELRSAGVEICMDDFGTGYSSLSYLQQLPVDAIKIDRSFVQQLGNEGKHEVVQTIVALARALKLRAVAEGTETAEQAAQLQALHCEYGQGWLFARAMEPAAMEKLLRQGRPRLPQGAPELCEQL